MKPKLRHSIIRLLNALCVVALFTAPATAQVLVVDMIPRLQSGETIQDGEPSLAVNPVNPFQIGATAFTPDPRGSRTAPIFVSVDGGVTWALTDGFLPGGNQTADITSRFGGAFSIQYIGFLRFDNFNLSIVRTNFPPPDGTTVLVERNNRDQPWVEAATALGTDRVYVGNNDVDASGGRTATVDQSLDAATAAPPAGFRSVVLEHGTTCGQDGPSVRPAIHPDGTVYVAFFRWTANCTTNLITSDVAVVRDDSWAASSTPYAALGAQGVNVAGAIQLPFNQQLGTERVGSSLAIAVDPYNSRIVYVAYGDGNSGANHTLHVRRSTDGGANWSPDLRTIGQATNPALAISSSRTLGFLYQRMVAPNWQTHLEMTTDAFATQPSDVLLANVPDIAGVGQPTIGDYLSLITVSEGFYGVFSAYNSPNPQNFPNGVRFQRNFNPATFQLLNVDNQTPVNNSIDPFFFRVAPAAAQLTVTKVVLPSGDPGLFNLQIDGSTRATNVGSGGSTGPQVLNPGTHIIGETLSSGTSPKNYITGKFSPPCSVLDGTIFLNPGEKETCIITNLGLPRLTVVKRIEPPDPGQFILQIDGQDIGNPVGNGGSTGQQVMTVGQHRVTERAAPGTDPNRYAVSFGGDCQGDGAGIATINLDWGDNKTCVISNLPASLTVNAVLVHPYWRYLRLFNLQIDGVTVRANVNSGSTGPQAVSPGNHRVGETGGTGTSLADFYVVIGGDCAPDGTVNLAPGDSKICTITNYDNWGGCPNQWPCCEPGEGEQGCKVCVKPPAVCP